MKKKDLYAENGVAINKTALKLGDEVRLAYHGLLKNSGASRVKAHIGYNDNWESCATLDMTLADNKFVTDITLSKAGTFNCAFVDPIGNWDNNSGENYSFKVSAGTRKKASEGAASDEEAPKPAGKSKAKKTKEAVKEAKSERNNKNKIKSA